MEPIAGLSNAGERYAVAHRDFTGLCHYATKYNLVTWIIWAG